MIDIEKTFEGRWRIKGFDDYEVRQLSGQTVKALCRDFFQAGVLLAEQETKSNEPSLLMEDFETWWNLYQKKRGKDKSMKKWAKMSTKDRQACIAATPAYVASTPDVIYRKDPLTYLNGKCWNDEIINRNGANTQPATQQQGLSKLASILTD